MNATAPALDMPTVAGTPFAGGTYAGRFFIGDKPFALIVAPAEGGELAETPWNESRKKVAAARSYSDGFANTEAMAEAGSSLPQWARGLRIGDFDDWYIPSRLESLVAFGELGAGDVFAREWYWTSTQSASYDDHAWSQSFTNGLQDLDRKDFDLRARAVRRLAIE